MYNQITFLLKQRSLEFAQRLTLGQGNGRCLLNFPHYRVLERIFSGFAIAIVFCPSITTLSKGGILHAHGQLHSHLSSKATGRGTLPSRVLRLSTTFAESPLVIHIGSKSVALAYWSQAFFTPSAGTPSRKGECFFLVWEKWKLTSKKQRFQNEWFWCVSYFLHVRTEKNEKNFSEYFRFWAELADISWHLSIHAWLEARSWVALRANKCCPDKAKQHTWRKTLTVALGNADQEPQGNGIFLRLTLISLSCFGAGPDQQFDHNSANKRLMTVDGCLLDRLGKKAKSYIRKSESLRSSKPLCSWQS